MAQKQREYKTYAQKMRRADREAAYSVIALVIIIIAWLIGGAGLSGLDIELASTPIWIIGGTVGTWVVSVIIAVVFAKRIFANFSLDIDDSQSGLSSIDAVASETLATDHVHSITEAGDK